MVAKTHCYRAAQGRPRERDSSQTLSTCEKLSPTEAAGIERDLRLHTRIRGLQEEGQMDGNLHLSPFSMLENTCWARHPHLGFYLTS